MSLLAERVANLKSPEECVIFEKNVLERGRPDLAVAARKRALELRAEKYGAGSEPERLCLQAVYAYAREDAELHEAAAAEADERAGRLETDLANALAQLDIANDAREAAQVNASRGATTSRGKGLTARKVMTLLWPTLILHSDSGDVIL